MFISRRLQSLWSHERRRIRARSWKFGNNGRTSFLIRFSRHLTSFHFLCCLAVAQAAQKDAETDWLLVPVATDGTR